MKIELGIDVEYQSTSDPKTAKEWLDNLPSVFSADFETAVRYSPEVIAEAKEKMVDSTLPRKEQIAYQAIAKSSALGHPSHCTITHCSIGISERNAYVFIIDSQDIADVVLDFLVTTEKTQVWHNYAYDGRFLRYYAGKDAINVEDTQIFAKTLINHVEVFKAATSLKDLMGAYYGNWAISKDNFDLVHQYDEEVLKYAAIDAAATFKLWEYLNDFVNNNQ